MPKRKLDLKVNSTPKLALTCLQILIIIINIIIYIAVGLLSDIASKAIIV